ncbi:hypothetical protein CAL26_05100 [Bordetella genomosp. 9]|uniref:Uncharacterized protein n=1 Tax=Bordetella genomosp. 9 TaxID=1416803 RepID=A0A261RP65_9BORD|nr:hypothetical protein [Bordetella genomosp. 9]OZI26701.1 hypothetical protein CAL26_05100 [Bordetella genomosp. 9]
MSRLEYFELMPMPVVVAACFDPGQFQKEMRRLRVTGAPPFTAGSPACVHTFEQGTSIRQIMCLDHEMLEDKTPIEVAALLCHEAVHVMQECRDWMNEKSAGSEWEAFMVQAVAQFFMSKYTEVA